MWTTQNRQNIWTYIAAIFEENFSVLMVLFLLNILEARAEHESDS